MTRVIGQSVVMRRHAPAGRTLAWLVALLVGALLPFAPLAALTPAASADPVSFDGKEIKDLCTINASGQSCPVFPPPPGLINAGALAAAGPDVAASMRALEDQAVANTLKDHQLPSSDRDAVLSWARTDAQAELWALIVEAINTSEADRTVDQQHAAEWMSALASAQANDAAKHAGAEYATWAGLDVSRYWNLADKATASELTTFLSSDVRTLSPLGTARGGYCRYTPPDPYTADYDGSETATCFTPCTSVLGCPIPTPKYDDFVKWGQASGASPILSTETFQQQLAKISAATTYAAVGVAASIVVGTAMAAVLSSSAVMATIWSTAAGFIGNAILAGTAAAGIAGAVLIVLVAIVSAVLEGIRVSENAKLPGQVAELVVNARTAVTDPAPLLTTTDGATTLLNLFVGATLPVPRNDLGCDNSLIPPWAYTSSEDPNLLIYVPLGANDVITTPTDRQGCLNPPPIPPASDTDPRFMVTPRTGGSPTLASTITVVDSSETTQKVRLSDTWFIAETSVPGRATFTAQALRLDYVDWEGAGRVAWLMRDKSVGYTFVGAKAVDGSTTIDPDTCGDDGTCWADDEIQYVGADGNDYSASVEGFEPATGTPTYSPATPLQASPVTFDAGDFAPGSSDGNLSYTWRFQRLGCGFLECLSGHQTPSYDGPFEGKTVDYTWQSIGPAKVELTATDQHGHSAQTVFVVKVGNVAPHVVAQHDNEAQVGVPVTLQGVFGDAGDADDLNVAITYGDGNQATTKVGPNSVPLLDPTLTRVKLPGTDWSLLATHAYTEPGIYYGTIAVSDWGGGTDFDTFTVEVTGPQQITFPAVGDQTYGDQLTPATGSTLSGVPLTYTAGPGSVCQATDAGQAVKLVGVGECTVTAHQTADPPMFLAASPVARTFEVTPAPLTIRAQFTDKLYGAENPVFTAAYTRLLNGDTADDITGLVFDGPAANADVGDYAITPSGASNPNYDISYVPGTLRIKPADLVVVVLDEEKFYGSPNPVFRVAYNGLATGDTEDDITGVVLTGPPADSEVGVYDIEGSGATSSNYEIFYSKGTFTITPAPLTISADDKTKVYGADNPAFTATYDGLVNGDTEDKITGLVLDGPPTGAGAGRHAITPSGASIPNYTIDYAAGTLDITPAELTITAEDKSKVYGADDPPFTASYDGLVNGDTEGDVHGLAIAGAPAGAGVGQYLIEPSGARNPDYDITFANGTLTITPAALSIRARDVTVASGRVLLSYPWSGEGWVNEDSDTTLAKPPNRSPSCSVQVPGVTVTSDIPPGVYPAAITCAGAVDQNYEIDYASGTLTVDPTISLNQLGLPDTVPHKAYVDRLPVTLPVVARQVGYDTRQTYRFPTVVLGSDGTTYVTSPIRFDGQVTQDIAVTASYLTMTQLVRRATGDQAIGKNEAKRLLTRWRDLEGHLAADHHAKAQKALHQFADEVRDQTGARIRAATAQDLLTYAQAVYHRIGGAGAI